MKFYKILKYLNFTFFVSSLYFLTLSSITLLACSGFLDNYNGNDAIYKYNKYFLPNIIPTLYFSYSVLKVLTLDIIRYQKTNYICPFVIASILIYLATINSLEFLSYLFVGDKYFLPIVYLAGIISSITTHHIFDSYNFEED